MTTTNDAMNAEVKAAAQFCNAVLAFPDHGPCIERWLGSRIFFPPIEMKKLIEDFLKRDGFNLDRSTYKAKFDNTKMRIALSPLLNVAA